MSASVISSAARQLASLPPGLPVDSDADLHLVVADLEGRLAGGRHGAARERHAHRSNVVLDALAASAVTAARSCPSSAAAPTIFSARTVPPTPRRPAV